MYKGIKADQKRPGYLGNKVAIQIFMDDNLRKFIKEIALENGMKYNYFIEKCVEIGLDAFLAKNYEGWEKKYTD